MQVPDRSLAAGVAHKGRVRLLFLAFFIYFLIGVILRKEVRPPYPGLYMPAFPGTGLARMTADEGETGVLRFIVQVRGQPATVISRERLFGNDFYPAVLPSKYFLLKTGPEPDAPLPDDAKQFLAKRLAIACPGQVVESVTFQLLRVSFPLDRPNEQRVLGIIDQRIIPFSP